MNRHVVISYKKNPVLNSFRDSEGGEQEIEANRGGFGLQENQPPVLDRTPVHVIEPIPVVLSESRLLNNFSNGDKNQISKRTKRLIHQAVEETLSAFNPRGIYRIFPFRHTDGFTALNDDVIFSSKYLSRILQDCDYAIVFVITLGKEIDNRIKKKITRFPSYGYILDYVAAAAAEETAQTLQRHIRETIPNDKAVTYRYSPGYCDWPLGEQEQLLQTIPHEDIGVKLSDSCLMSPRKSVSGVFGICSAELGMKSMNQCIQCRKKNCPHRRK